MAEFGFAAATKKADGQVDKTASKKEPPMAYIFIGREKNFRTERTPQEWRKLFVVLSRMAIQADSNLSANRFGLAIVFDALVEFEKVAKKALGKDYESEVERHWKDALAEDALRAQQAAKRASEKGSKPAEDDVEEALKQSVSTAGSKPRK